jgi:catechol 2,3-dioxygenase-like lactoylglutathione lyase family enzyme
MYSHITLGTNDLAKAKEFYDAALAPLGLSAVMEFDGAVGYGESSEPGTRLFVCTPFDGKAASFGNGTHIAPNAPTRAAVDAFHAAAMAQGGSDEGAPGLRPQYTPNYYGAYVRDLDGNKLQAVCYASE